MADPKNTGPGGFGIDGKQELFDTGMPEPSDPENPYGPFLPAIDTSKSFIDSSGKPKDLTVVTKTTLSKYLSDLTKGREGSTPVANEYPVDAGYNPESTTTPDGNPGLQSPGSAPVDNSAAFAPVVSDLSSLSDSYPTISTLLKKGKASYNAVDGNDLLPGLPGTSGFTANEGSLTGDATTVATPVGGHQDTSKVVAPYVSAVLGRNRFSLASQAFGGLPASNAGFNPTMTQQSKLGAYDPKAPTVTPDQLATVGPLLTMRASAELGATNPGADPNSVGLQASALLPGLAQLGISRVDPTVLEASDVLKQLTSDVLDSSDVISIGDNSWGQLNNTDDPFSGTDALGMLALSVALVAGVELLFDGLDVLLGLITPSTKMPNKDNQGRYVIGQYFLGEKSGNKAAGGGIGGALSALSSLNFGALLGILPTTFPFQLALSTGTDAFFQVPSGGGIGGQIAGALTSSADSPGFNVVVARAIIRSGITIVDQLKKIGGNPMNVINQVLSLIDVIRSSKLIAACNVFATLGDAILSDPARWSDPDQSNKTSAMDQLSNSTLGTAIVKSRLQGTLKLAWASNRAPANLLLPANIFGTSAALAGQNLGQLSPFVGVPREGYSLVKSTLTTAASAGRIDSVTAAAFEDKLEASYVPFYFHDVRTNEMVAFHAFLASLTDDFAASYERSDGMGRVEPVRTYKGTERHINLSFYIVATSLPDFDDMWTKINKLVTLVYPQYTKGVQLSNNDQTYVFTQPFSQLVGASPLIRIRLGDLLRSNYSPYALGRLFGLGNQDFTVNGDSFLGADSLSQGDVDNLQMALEKTIAHPQNETYIPSPGIWPLFVAPAQGGVSLPSPSIPGAATGPQNAPQFSPDKAVFEIVATQVHPNNPNLIVGTVQFRTDDAFQAYFQANQAALNDQYNSPKDDINRAYVGGQYVFPAESLAPTAKTMQKLLSADKSIAGSVISANSSFATDLAAFLDPSKNAVAKSFADTAGKGLAGFIETMNFDWYDKVTWETQDGRVAPKLCKVTISFAPIHDISPGLDHNGFNRSPLYPVGVMGQQR